MIKVGGIRKIMVRWQAGHVFLAASPLVVTSPPSNLTRLNYNGSAAKSHSTTAQYRQLRRLNTFNNSPVEISCVSEIYTKTLNFSKARFRRRTFHEPNLIRIKTDTNLFIQKFDKN